MLGAGVGAGDGAGDGAGAGDGDGVGAGADAVTLGDVGVEPPPHCAEVSVTTPSANAMSDGRQAREICLRCEMQNSRCKHTPSWCRSPEAPARRAVRRALPPCGPVPRPPQPT
ncbi:MAG: hypothetical protein DMF88_05015 [Acidobacteria bacterium]|nr:MAG: hypothetical protein DMF88_05015 [Acidobacteriota bacterium]